MARMSAASLLSTTSTFRAARLASLLSASLSHSLTDKTGFSKKGFFFNGNHLHVCLHSLHVHTSLAVHSRLSDTATCTLTDRHIDRGAIITTTPRQ